ncbi:Vacuolar protein sorting-associated protein vps5 [Coemansia biformis]|uniref:Vacuolar protein sorting-associated protein vps5 n=1 Tax=Coemansia biformis TaxID=1286918 RepID=A0A9W7YFB6_9FUNG|nr:Vacuolar protein sorting-associated protein vps5 [Coemansia biformis]
MDSDGLFGGGFGSARPQPFAFDARDMNPFGDADSPWNDAPPSAGSTSQSAEVASDDGSGAAAGDSGARSDGRASGDESADSLHRAVADKLRIAADTAGNEVTDEGPPAAATAAAAAAATATEMSVHGPGPLLPTPQAARYVGVIKRGLRSPRVLGKKLSPSSLEDPLSSAAAVSDADDPLTSAAQQMRASVDVLPVPQGLRGAGIHARQTRSMSEARSGAGAAMPAGRPPASSPANMRPYAHPHPYDQQLSPPLQHEQEADARLHIEGAQPSPSKRPGVAPSRAPASAPGTQHAYLGSHQRRRSLDPTPQDEIPPFHIQVTDPVKVSDALKSYIAYRVRTRCDAPMFRESEMVVRRRYRDFDWLIQELVARHPGVVVPAIPEKQSMGRFEDEFVEARRAGLESCLDRVSRHPVLWNDDVFRLFLSADDFAPKARAITETRVAAEINGTALLLSGGIGGGSGGGGGSGAGSGISISSVTGSGLFGDGWGGAKYKEKDEWFARRMEELDATEEELRALLRALELSQRQRRELSLAHGELAEAYLLMAGQELSQSLASSLTDMGSLQQKLRALQGRQGAADFTAFQLTTDEYIRMIGAVRTAFAARSRAYGLWQTNLAELLKKRKILEGHSQHPGRATPERISQLRTEIARAEIRTETSRNAFDDVSQLLKHEVARFDAARVCDFQAAIEAYLTSLVDTQEEIVTLWEAYLASLRNAEPATNSRAGA